MLFAIQPQTPPTDARMSSHKFPKDTADPACSKLAADFGNRFRNVLVLLLVFRAISNNVVA